MWIGGLILVLIYICLLIGSEFGVVLMTIGFFYGLYKGWQQLEKKWSRYRHLENAMSQIYSIQYMYTASAKKKCLDNAKDYFTYAIKCGYKPEKDERWTLVRQYMDKIERIDETSAD